VHGHEPFKKIVQGVILLLCDMFSSVTYPIFFINSDQHRLVVSGQIPFQN